MFILGHTGITTQLAYRLDPKVSLKVVALVALYPDLIDKSIHYIICPLLASDWTHGCTRTVAHSMTVNVMVMVGLMVWWWRGRKNHPYRWVYAAIIPVHLILDGMWNPELRVILFWPWYGSDFPRIADGFLEHLWRVFSKGSVLIGEVIGLFCLLNLRRKKRLTY